MSEQLKLEQRISKLRLLEASLQKMLVAMGNLYLAEKPKQLKALTAAMAKVSELKAHKVVGTSRLLDSCVNELVSLREGLFTGAVSSRDKKELMLSTASATLAEIQALTQRTEMRLARVASQDDEGYSTLEAAEEDEQAQFVIDKNSLLKDSLPAIKSKLFVVGRAPVVVVTDPGGVRRKGMAAPFVNHKVLQTQGFKVDNLDGYAIVHEQLVIGVTKNKELLKSKDPVVVADSVLRRLEQVTKKPLALVLQKPFAYNNTWWFWAMPNREMNQFAKAFPGGHVKLNDWGFAFN